MGMFFPCLLAAILNADAIQVFREPVKIGNGPLLALYMFIFSTFILLWSVRLYPRNLRKIGKLQFIIEFFVAQFLMEDLIIDFWFPLEKTALDFLPHLAHQIDDLTTGNWNADYLTHLLRHESTGFYLSYILATFFLVATLHASRIIDLRTLSQDGPACFFKEISRKIKMGFRRILRKFNFFNKSKKVKINELKNTHQDPQLPTARPSCSSKSDYYSSSPSKYWDKSYRAKNSRKPEVCKYCPVQYPYDHEEDSYLDDYDDLGSLSDMDYRNM